MLVYGDPQYCASLSWILSRLRDLLASTDPAWLDAMRRVLIAAGQLEQAVADFESTGGGSSSDLEAQLVCLTNDAAMACCELWSGEGCKERLAQLARALDQIHLDQDEVVTIKIPEGFEFYALFPEQYCLSAQRWSREHPKSAGEVLVIGIRSIGTTLSAVVWATLAREGWNAKRITVRPTGHPFNRIVELPEDMKCDLAVIVDEGPGLSGSSMAAVAQALHERGVAREAIAFFSGNDRTPVEHANEMAHGWWSTTKRYFTPLEAVTWDDKLLVEVLAARARELLGAQVTRTEDLGAGRWRQRVFAEESEWPAVTQQFEQTKHLQLTRDGHGLLWRFTGLGCLDVASSPQQQMEARALLGWTRAPIAHCYGFTAIPWLEGKPLQANDCDQGLLHLLAAYIVDVAGAPLSADEAEAALERMRQMLEVNAHEAGIFVDHAVAVEGTDLTGLPSYGDGRMAPHEWLLTADDRVLKTDAYSHIRDHTLVGRQPILWDVAGVIVEWELSFDQAGHFLEALALRGCHIDGAILDFYVACYAAFRLGIMTLCLAGQSGPEEERLHRAANQYRNSLTRSSAVAQP